jgi:hypothetical protein
MGVEILLQHQMTRIHREAPFAGRVLGITAMEVDNWYQPKFRTLNIRARKGIVVATVAVLAIRSSAPCSMCG